MRLLKRVKWTIAIAASTVIAIPAIEANASIINTITDILSFLDGDFYAYADQVTQDLDNPLADIISESVNISGGEVGNIDANIVFDETIQAVSEELGIPSEIVDVINGGDPLDILMGVLQEALGDIGLDEINLETVLGDSGIPIPETITGEIAQDINTVQSIVFETDIPVPDDVITSAAEAGTVNVNPALLIGLQSLKAINNAVTASGLSEEGQAVTAATQTAAATITEAGGDIGSLGTAVADVQMEAAEALGEVIPVQDSTQDVLKEALTAMAAMNANALQISAGGNELAALGLHLDRFILDTGIQTRDVVSGAALGIQGVNEQLNRDHQAELTEKLSQTLALQEGPRLMTAGIR